MESMSKYMAESIKNDLEMAANFNFDMNDEFNPLKIKQLV